MKSTLNATVCFGLVSFPVGIAAMTTKTETVSFKLLHEECGTPIKTQRVCPHDGQLLDSEDLVHGWEYAKGHFVTVTDDELKAAKGVKQPMIRISKFVPWSTTSWLPVSASSFLMPDGLLSESYGLLVAAMMENEADALGKCNLWGKERPFLLTVQEDALILQRLFMRQEVKFRDFAVPDIEGVDQKQLKVASQIVKMNLLGLDPEDDLQVDSERVLRQLVESKAKGTKPPALDPEEPIELTKDIMIALKQTLGAGLVSVA